MELWLVRHGTTQANREQRFQGQLNTVLSLAGKEESERIACRLSHFCPDWFFSSDLRRAWDTALIISREIKVKVNPWAMLRECSWGIIEGMTRRDVERNYPELKLSRLPAAIPGAERKRRLMVRARSVISTLSSIAGNNCKVLMVSHGRFINALISTCLDLRARDFWPFCPAPASLSILNDPTGNNKFNLIKFNDCAHLR